MYLQGKIYKQSQVYYLLSFIHNADTVIGNKILMGEKKAWGTQFIYFISLF